MMCKQTMLIPVVCVAAIVGSSRTASAVPEMPWSSIDGGSARMVVGGYTLAGTVGQHDAGPAASGAGYTLRGGFWQVVAAAGDPGCNAADVAEPFGVLDLADIASFVGAFQAGDLLADLTGDTVLDLSDIGAFLTAFTGGCP